MAAEIALSLWVNIGPTCPKIPLDGLSHLGLGNSAENSTKH